MKAYLNIGFFKKKISTKKFQANFLPELPTYCRGIEIGDKWIIFVWDTREVVHIIDSEKLKDCKIYSTKDSGLQLWTENQEFIDKLSTLGLIENSAN